MGQSNDKERFSENFRIIEPLAPTPADEGPLCLYRKVEYKKRPTRYATLLVYEQKWVETGLKKLNVNIQQAPTVVQAAIKVLNNI